MHQSLKPSKTVLIPALLALCAITVPARADLVLPPEATAPSATQIQHPPSQQPAPGEAIPVALTQEAAKPIEAPSAAQQTRIEALLKTLLADEAVIPVTASSAEVPEDYAKNLAAESPTPRYTVRMRIGALQSPIFGKPYLPVTLTVDDTRGQTLGAEQIRYQDTNEMAFKEEARTFLARHLNLVARSAPVPTSAAPVSSEGNALSAPRLYAWIETRDGAPVHIGSEIALYYQSSTKGYVSLYHFGASGQVTRIYPLAHEPYNFTEAERIYRYPDNGRYMRLEGPAGEETVKAILTVLPSNTPRTQPGGMRFKSDPLQVIPTHYPVLFASQDLSRFFALPPHLYTETHISYTLKAR